MTNEEAISKLDGKKELLDRNGFINLDEFDIAINSIQENTKLKTEIERLNGKSEMYRDMADSFCNRNIKLEAEIEELNKRLDRKETLLKLQEVTMSMLSSDKDTFIHLYQDAKAEIEQLRESIPKICETCKYEDLCGTDEPCNSCKNSKNWILKGQV